jgi:NTE family protein
MGGVGLVLGAGGIVGQAYQAGVLAALEHDYGWDARKAEVIVGTSAGSITGTLLRRGVRASALAAWTVKAPLARQGRVLRLLQADLPELEPFRALGVFRHPPDLPGREMLQRALIRPWHFRPMAAALALLAPGHYDIVEQLAALRTLDGQAWPQRDLWICAVRRRDGRRVVFGRPGTIAAPLHLAIAASCAVPGYFTPVQINDHTYVDGGAHSPTNAAVLRERGLDLVVVLSPMSGPVRVPTDFYGASRWHASRLARREVAALRARGTAVVVFRPGPVEQEVMGTDIMSRDRVDQVLQRSFIAAGAYAARPEIRERLLGAGASCMVGRPRAAIRTKQ